MRAARFHEYGDPDVLHIDTVDKPTPSADEIRVRVRAAGVNPVDTYLRAPDRSYQPAALPAIPGLDFAGEVDAVGGDVTDFEVGGRVFGTGAGLDRAQGGSCADFVVVPTDRVVLLPEEVPFNVGGAVGVAAVTAWRALIDHAGLEPGETCLIHGGSGGVGHTAVQIAAATGARVVTTAAPANHDAVRELGADAVLDYARNDLADAVIEATGGGPDVILDHMLQEYLQFDADVAAPCARIALLRNRHLSASFTDVPSAGGKELQFTVMSMTNTPRLSEPLSRLTHLLEDGALTVVVHRAYDLDQAAAAHRAVADERFFGKLVLTP